MTAKRLQLILVVTLALSMSIFAFGSTTYAQSAIGVNQDVVRVLEGNWQTLSPGTQHWYRFDYSGEGLPIYISMDVNAANGAGFQLWTADQFAQLAVNSEMAPLASSTVDANDATHLVWQGTLGEPGTYYIVVQPSTQSDTQYLLNIGGRGLAPAADGGTIVSGALNVNIRTGPSTAYSVIRTIPQNTQLTVLGQDATGTWLSVRLPDGTEGWIARFLTGFTDTSIAVVTPAQPPLAPPATTAPGADVSGAFNVNVRSGPSTLYSVIDTVARGTQFTILGQDASGTWLAVRLADGTEGWIARYLTDYTGTANIVAAPPLTQPPLAPPATLPTDGVYVSGALNVNLRSGPSTSYGVMRVVPNGTQLNVLGQDATGTWLSVALPDGTVGWIARYLTNFAGNTAIVTTPVQPPLAPPASVPPVATEGSGTPVLPSRAASIDDFPIEETLSGNWRVLRSGETQWFTFSHPGDSAPVQIWMDSEPNGAIGFEVFGEEQARSIMDGANPDDVRNIGSGTPNENESGNLFWRGEFEEHGRYFVMIHNSTPNDVSYSIYGVGPSIGG